MTYTLLQGLFVIRYGDLPGRGPEPDGDTIKFLPDRPDLVKSLPLASGRPAKLNARGVSVRLEAVDALETHFSGTHQELAGANAARDALLAGLGFTGVRFSRQKPNQVESADQDAIYGHVLSNGIDANGRMISFVYPGEPAAADGAEVFLDPTLAAQSSNARLLEAGLVYPAFYDTLPADLREHLATLSRAARSSQRPDGIWGRSTADPDGPAQVSGLAALQELVIWPKLFRRLVSYLADGHQNFDALDSWLREDPVLRDDALFLLEPQQRARLHDVVRAAGQSVQLTVWPDDLVIAPDPAPAHAQPTSSTVGRQTRQTAAQ
jgi:hypothetical protein